MAKANRGTHTKISVQIKTLPTPYGELELHSTVPKFGVVSHLASYSSDYWGIFFLGGQEIGALR
jgi:hypothetical protein